MRLLLPLYFEKLRYEKNISPHTLRAYISDTNHFADFFESLSLASPDALRPEHISQWLESLSYGEKLQPRSVARRLAAMASFYRYLNRQGLAVNNPFALFHAPRARKNTPLTSSPEEMLAVLDALPETTGLEIRNKVIFYTLYGTGIRSEELCTLSLNDISLQRAIIKVKGKGNKERLVSLLPPVAEKLSLWLELRPSFDRGISKALFLSKNGQSLDTSLIRRLTAMLPFKGKHFRPHAFRYSFGSHMLEGGADLRSIQELLGHSRLATTERYTKIGIERLRAQYQQFHPHA